MSRKPEQTETEPEPSALISIETREEQRITEKVNHWQALLGLGNIAITSIFNNDPEIEDFAEVVVEWQYKRADMTFYTARTIELDDAVLDTKVVHEMAHIILGPLDLYVPSKDEWLSEHTASTIQEAIQNVAQHFQENSAANNTQQDTMLVEPGQIA